VTRSGEVVVTGGCGFIGSRLALALVAAGEAVRLVDIVDPPADLEGRCPFERRDVTRPSDLAGAFRGARCVVHCAAHLSRGCGIDPAAGWTVNVEGTMNVLREVGRAGEPPRVLFPSTGGVYRAAPAYPVGEDGATAAHNLYTASKLAGEAMLVAAAMRSGLAAVVLRLFTVYGPGPASGRRGHFVAGWVERIEAGEPLPIHGSGEQTIDATHVDDVVRAIRAAMACAMPASACATYNVGSGRETRVAEVAAYLREVHCRIEVVHVPAPRPPPARQFADITRARAELGYEPTVTPRHGLQALLRARLAEDRR